MAEFEVFDEFRALDVCNKCALNGADLIGKGLTTIEVCARSAQAVANRSLANLIMVDNSNLDSDEVVPLNARRRDLYINHIEKARGIYGAQAKRCATDQQELILRRLTTDTSIEFRPAVTYTKAAILDTFYG